MPYLAENFLNMRPFIVIFAFLASFLTTFGQVQWPETGMWPESPQAQAIREVMMPTPALLTGACEFSVPLYTIEVEGVQIPLTLQYRSNGVRVGDDPQPIGYGWTLTPPLRVSRQIFGRPDEYFEYSGNLPATYTDEKYSLFFEAARRLNGNPTIQTAESLKDPGHDVFRVYLLDRTLTLILKNRKFVGVNCSEYRVELDSIPSAAGSLPRYQIKVTDPKGLIYDFSTPGEYVEAPLITTEWLLTSITLQSGRKIEFAWTDSAVNAVASNNKTTSVLYNKNGNLCDISLAGSDPYFRYGYNYGGHRYLKSVTYPGSCVIMNYSGTGDSNVMLKSVYAESGNERFYTARLEQDGPVLSKVTVNNLIKYSFGYNSTKFAPETAGCDWWGFYNNTTNVNGCVVPAFHGKTTGNSIFPGRMASINGADRKTDANAMQAYMLKKVTLPTGGIIEWIYETHKFADRWCDDAVISARVDVPVLNEGGGLRVKAKLMRESLGDSNPIVKSYLYGKGGDGLAEIVAAPLLNTFISEIDVVQFRTTYNGGSMATVDKLLTINSQSDYLTGQTGAVPIWYSEVAEIEAEGKTVYNFKNYCSDNKVSRTWGSAVATENYTTFSKGPRLEKTTVYKSTSAGYKPVQEKTNYYGIVKSSEQYYLEYQPERQIIQLDDMTSSPDFGSRDVLYCTVKDYSGFAESQPAQRQLHRSAYEWYRTVPLRVEMQTERLDSCVVLDYTDNNCIMRTSESYKYVPGTSLIRLTAKTNGEDVSLKETIYPDRSTTTGEAMIQANVVGVPLGTKTTFNGSTTETKISMRSCNSARRVFRPGSIEIRRGQNDFYTNKHFSYDSLGNKVFEASTDNVKITLDWDSLGTYVTSRCVSGKLTTKTDYQGKENIITVTSPAGVKEEYRFSVHGYPTWKKINGRMAEAYGFTVGQTGDNRSITRRYISETKSLQEIEYYDGLGRVKSSVSQTGSQTFATTATFYDNMGRPCRTVAPVESGEYCSPEEALARARQFYYDGNPYNTIEYEASPRARSIAAIKAGSAWHNAGRKVMSKLYTNVDDGITRYDITSDGVVPARDYRKFTLVREITEDEDGNTTEIYKDMRGLTIVSANANGRTHYIYDNYGDLRYVLPPGAEKGGKRTLSRMQQLAYWYDYDIHGNCILRKVPGCKEARYKYDPAGRLVAEQSANHAAGEWRLYGYDDCGRQVLAVDCKLTDDKAVEFSSKCRTATLTATDNTSTGGYAFTPSAEIAPTLVWARYYDNYTFSAVYPDQSENYFKFGSDTPLTELATAPMGLLTGIATGAGYEMYFYNKDGREIQRYATGYNVGRRSTSYTYDGQPAKLTYYYPSGVLRPREVINTYDDAGRLSSTVTKETSKIYLNGDENNYTTLIDSAVIRYNYDALGRVVNTGHGPASRSYSYDIHSWPTLSVTNAKDVTITERLMYADGARPRFNGTISSKITNDGRYDYTYDPCGFLIGAKYSAADNSGADFSTEYGYDKRGNMVSMMRRGVIDHTPDGTDIYGLLDDATMTLTGNQITSVSAQSDGAIFSGKTGVAENGEFALSYDSSGRLVSDESRGIKSVEYNNDGRPTRVVFDDGHVHENVWDGLGRHIKTRYYIEKAPVFIAGGRDEGSLGGLIGGIGTGVRSLPNSVRTYTGDGHIIRSGARLGTDTLELAAFPGGYFSKLKPYYHIADYQGNVVAVLDYTGYCTQRTSYYPYGEQHRESSFTKNGYQRNKTLSPFAYTGKERQTVNGLDEYAYPARQYTYRVPFFTTVDALAEKRYNLSPYIMCASDPINNIDPSGLDCYLMNKEGYISHVETGGGDMFIFYDVAKLITDEYGNDRSLELDVLDFGEEMVVSKICNIITHSKADNKDYKTLILEVNNSNAAKRIFEFFADNTSVEFSRIEMMNTAGERNNYIGTTHRPQQDVSFISIFERRKIGELIVRYDHNHPRNMPYPSTGDLEMARAMINATGNEYIEFNIYLSNAIHKYIPF